MDRTSNVNLVRNGWIFAFFAALLLQGALNRLLPWIAYTVGAAVILIVTGVATRGGLGKSATSSEESLLDDKAEPLAPAPPMEGEQAAAGNNNIATGRRRYVFLDNLKVFLTFLVVSHHCACSFGGCPANAWFLTIGYYDSIFRYVIETFTLLNQAFFMPCFFLIAAYFTPASLQTKGSGVFLRDRGQRLWWPALFVTFVITPLAYFIATRTPNTASWGYYPAPAHAWFLLWLLVFSWVYVTFQEAAVDDDKERLDAGVVEEQQSGGDEDDPNTSATQIDTSQMMDETDEQQQYVAFPDMLKRYVYGACVCGLAALAFALILDGSFYTMPTTIGSFFCNALLFYAGILAHNHDWLSNLRESLGGEAQIRLVSLAVVTVALIAVSFVPYENAWGLLVVSVLFVLAGIFCVEMCVFLVDYFQSHAAEHVGSFGTFLCEAAYTVYIIHPPIVVLVTYVFIQVYNGVLGGNIIMFYGNNWSESVLNGPGDGSLHLLIGFVIVLVVSHVICWPLAYGIRSLPGLRHVL